MRDVRLLPKAHLHLHFEGSARPSTIIELAARAGVDYEPPTAFGSFAEFEAAYLAMVEFIRTPDDVVRICHEIVADEAMQGVAYTQPMFAPGFFSERFGMSDAEVFDVMRSALLEAATAHGIGIGFLLAGIWTLPIASTEAAAHFAAERADRNVIAFGLAGVEPVGGYGRWARACAIAREAGLLIVPHTGELGGPLTVASAVDYLRPDRIAHGLRASEEPELVARLANMAIACDICPTSNVKLGVFPSMPDVPLPQFLAAGVPVTLNSDDQLFFGSMISDEYAAMRDTFGLTDSELAAIAHTSADVSGAPAELTSRMHRDIDAWLATPA